MPLHGRSIDSHGFTPLSSASDMENYGLGNFAVDLGLGLGMESLGAGFMGAPGAFGGRPILGRIPGVMPGGGGGFTTAGKLFRGMAGKINAPYQAMPGSMGIGAGSYDPFADLRASHTGNAGEARKLRARSGGSRTGLLRAHAGDAALRGAATDSLAWRLGVGMGLRTLASAWIINDMFSLGFMATSSAIQGMSAFSYERKSSTAPRGEDLDLGEGLPETRASFTQRQRAMEAIHNSQMSTRAAMGNEATFMHV